jgi:peptide/nickel transport system substrate-binding protein
MKAITCLCGPRTFLVVLVALFALCTGPVGAASEPGTVTIVSGTEPYNLDPHDNVMGMTEGQALMKTVVEPLTSISSEDGRIVPLLATSWKQVDPNTWQFVLRKGVKFHDGENFNAEVVVYNLKRLMDPKFDSRLRGKFFAQIKMDGKALDSNTLEIKTAIPEPLMPVLMSFIPICSPNTPMGKWTRQPIGTGPYKFVKWDAGIQLIFDQFDGYWGKQPQVKKVVHLWRKESSVMAAMVQIGEADFAPNISVQDANSPDMDHSYFDTETTHLRFGGAWDAPLNDKRFRMAVNYAIDRNSLKTVLSKDVIPAALVVLPQISGYNPDIKVWPYDPEKAKQLLAEAKKDGVPVDKEVLLVTRLGHFPGSGELSEALMSMLRAVGINAKLKVLEVAVYNRFRVKPYPTDSGPYIILNKHDNNFGDAVYTFPYLYHTKGGISVTADKTLDSIIDKAQVSVGDERRNLWRTAFKRIRDEIVPDAMLFHMVAYCRVGKRINFKPYMVTATEIRVAEMTFK